MTTQPEKWHEEFREFLKEENRFTEHSIDFHEFGDSDLPETVIYEDDGINYEIIYITPSDYVSAERLADSEYVIPTAYPPVVLIQVNGANFKKENYWSDGRTFVWGLDNPNWCQNVYDALMEIITTSS